MKHVYFLAVLLSLCSCMGTKYEIRETNDVFTPTQDLLFLQCSKLKGLGTLEIDKTTYRQLKKDAGLSVFTSSYLLDSDFYFGEWGCKNHEMNRFLEKSQSIKQVRIPDYKIGDIELGGDIFLAFLDDVLVAISLEDRFYKIREGIIAKYGNGKGHYKLFIKSHGVNGDSDFYLEKLEDEIRVWENENVKFEYVSYWKSKVQNNVQATPTIQYGHCIISSKKRYETFIKLLEEEKQNFKEEKEQKKQSSYDML